MQSRLEYWLRRDRQLVGLSLLLVSLASWAFLFSGAGMGMSGLEMTRHSMMGMDTPGQRWDLARAVLMFFMWWIMMIAMMLPSATPAILLSSALNRMSRESTPPFGSAMAFTAGYLLTWAVFSAVMVALQWLLASNELISGMMQSTSRELNAVLLLAAGLWQFSPWKQSCLRHCRSPVDFLTRHRRAGHGGAMIMGSVHGTYCLGCCWFLMILLFVGGVMNLLWIAALAIYVWIEKVLPGGAWTSRVAGGLLIATAVALLVT